MNEWMQQVITQFSSHDNNQFLESLHNTIKNMKWNGNIISLYWTAYNAHGCKSIDLIEWYSLSIHNDLNIPKIIQYSTMIVGTLNH